MKRNRWRRPLLALCLLTIGSAVPQVAQGGKGKPVKIGVMSRLDTSEWTPEQVARWQSALVDIVEQSLEANGAEVIPPTDMAVMGERYSCRRNSRKLGCRHRFFKKTGMTHIVSVAFDRWELRPAPDGSFRLAGVRRATESSDPPSAYLVIVGLQTKFGVMTMEAGPLALSAVSHEDPAFLAEVLWDASGTICSSLREHIRGLDPNRCALTPPPSLKKALDGCGPAWLWKLVAESEKLGGEDQVQDDDGDRDRWPCAKRLEALCAGVLSDNARGPETTMPIYPLRVMCDDDQFGEVNECEVCPLGALHKVAPRYPPEAKKVGIQGAVQTQVFGNRDGHVIGIRWVSGAKVFKLPIYAAVVQWRFEPQPRAFTFRQPFDFSYRPPAHKAFSLRGPVRFY